MTTTDNQSARMGGLKDAAAQLNCSVSTIRRRVADGTIPAVRLGKRFRIDLDALPGRGPAAPHLGGASPESVAALVSEVVLAAPVLTDSHVRHMVRVVRQAYAGSES